MTADEYMTMSRLLNNIMTETNHAKLVLESKYGKREDELTQLEEDARIKTKEVIDKFCKELSDALMGLTFDTIHKICKNIEELERGEIT